MILSGGETDVCVLAAVMDAVDAGYLVILAEDALCSVSENRTTPGCGNSARASASRSRSRRLRRSSTAGVRGERRTRDHMRLRQGLAGAPGIIPPNPVPMPPGDEQGKSGGRMSDLFSQAAHWTGQQCGRASVFMAAVVLIIAWAITGPVFHYSDTWQLIINTSTTIVTFLMVFLLQNTQNRDTAAIQLKLDELIRANEDARNKMLCLEDLSEDELKKVKATFASLAAAPAAADAGEAPHGAAAELHRATREPVHQLEGVLSAIAPLRWVE